MKNLFTIDILILSTEEKPNPSNMQNGSTLYEVDTQKFYIAYKNQWYLQGGEE